jgi:predicted GNAT superfamily acetyltransferase
LSPTTAGHIEIATGIHVKRLIAEWFWRAAIVCALGWIGWEMHQIRVQMQQPDDEATTAAAPADLQGNLDELSDGIAKLNEKVDAMMVAMLSRRR